MRSRMIKYCNDICNANVDNITSLMIENIDDDRIALRAKVEDALKVLMRQMLVQKNGDVYVFLTDEEQEINREIDSQNVEMAEVINKVSEMIFEDIFTEKKYRYPAFNGRYSFGFNQTVDDRPYKGNQTNDVGVRVLTPASEVGTDETTLRMILRKAISTSSTRTRTESPQVRWRSSAGCTSITTTREETK